MVQLILIFNIVIMFLFLLACWVIITPAHNHFIQYGATGSVLPYLTQIAIDARFFLLLIPILWIAISFRGFKKIGKQKESSLQGLMLFILVSLSAGFIMVIFYGMAGILPYLKIGATL